MDYAKRAREIIETEIQGLIRVKNELNSEFDRAVTLILDSLRRNGKIVVTGVGKNLLIGEKISATLASTGSTSVVLNPTQAMHGDLGILRPGDVLLTLSYSGESDELIRLIPTVRRLDVKVIAVTGARKSTLAECADEIIVVTVDREACPFNMAPTTSTTATMAVGDALAIVLLEQSGFNKDDYAKLHPGGAIGRALLLRARDIMRVDDRVPALPAAAKVKDALLAMTRARSGSTMIVDGEKRLIGIFTDGDLRRLLVDTPRALDLPMERVMTRSPRTIHADQLAVDALRMFEDHKVDDLPVVDSGQHLVGAIDIQDLPRLKIM